MSLNDLEEKLYDSDSGIEKRTHEESQFNPLNSSNADLESLKKEKQWQKPEGSGIDMQKVLRIGAMALGAIIIIAAFVVGVVKYRQSAFKEEKVLIKVEGPANASGVEEAEYKITIQNKNRVDLNNAQLLIKNSENFKPKEDQNLIIDSPSNSRIVIGTIKGKATKELKIRGTFFAAENTVVYLNAVLEYSPNSLSLKYQAKGQLGVNVGSSPLFLEVEAPLEIVSGNKVDYVIDYRNLSTEYFDGVRLKVKYPDGFSFIASNPSPSEGDNIWYLGSLRQNQDGKIVISGNLSGSGDEGKIVTAYLGYFGEEGNFAVYNQKEKMTKIVSTILSIKQFLNNKADLNVNPGENLYYIIEYGNNGDIALKDVIITEEIDSRVLDFSKLELKNGSYDASKKMITWRAAEIPGLANLAPGEGGKITFSIPVLDRIPVENSNDKNFIVSSTAKIDSPSVPEIIGSNKVIASNNMSLKLNSRVVLDVKGYYNDKTIENSGPIPPKVGQETSYTMHWKVINVSNDISNAKVVSSLPSGVRWIGKFSPDNEAISFNERTNQIEWEIGNLKNGVGIFDPIREISFQIGVIPQVNQIGEKLILLNPSVLTAKDLFTDADVKVEVKEKENILREDADMEDRYKVEQ
jgi:hypothetical protein